MPMHREEIIVHSILMAQTRLLVWMFLSHYLSLHFVPTAASLWHLLCTSEILPTSSGKMTLCKVLTMQSRIINEEAHSVSFTVLYLTHPLWLQVSAHHRDACVRLVSSALPCPALPCGRGWLITCHSENFLLSVTGRDVQLWSLK